MSKVADPNGNAGVIQVFRLTVAKMSALSIPLTGQNYALWYAYFSNSNVDLNSQIDAQLKTEQPFSEQRNLELYQQFFDANSKAKLNELRQAISTVTRHLSLQMATLLEDMDDYDSVLHNCESQLSPNADVNVLSQLITTLLEETKKARTAGQSTAAAARELNKEIVSLRALMAVLSEETLVDSLTDVGNRRAFDQMLAQTLRRSHQAQHKFCLLMMDIDHFKQFNDSYGHLAGDSVLRYVAKNIKKSIKGQDFVARYGGEEFSLILPNTDYRGGMVVAQAIADKISQRALTAGKDARPIGRVTLSIGVAIFQLGDDADKLIGRADNSLYRAKADGRNKVLGERD